MEDIKQRQIEQLQRDIRILEEIISGKMENYTSHPIPVLKEGLSKYQSDLARLQEKRWERGGIKGGSSRAYASARGNKIFKIIEYSFFGHFL
jgi:hypothetical protein